jgi:hypothetical protein
LPGLASMSSTPRRCSASSLPAQRTASVPIVRSPRD